MSLHKKPQIVEAVMLFNTEGHICQEMLYPEFEALLDGVVNLHEFAGQQARGAYLLINPRLQVKAVVLFYLDFTEAGRADPAWNVPLRHLAEYGGNGPDLGGGTIRLACRSQCPVELLQGSLWDPSLAPTQNDLLQIRDAVRANQLGLIFEDDRPLTLHTGKLNMAPEHRWYIHPDDMAIIDKQAPPRREARRMDDESRYKAAQLIRQQRLRINTLTKQHEEELARERLTATRREQAMQARMAALERALRLQIERNESLKEQLSAQAQGFEQVREEMTRQMQTLVHDDKCELNALREQFEHEVQVRINAAVLEYQERLQRQDECLALQAERQGELLQDNARLHGECERLAVESGDRILERLAGQGIMFIAYHPGAGHLTIPLHEISSYQRNPQGYVAARCLVTEEQYGHWLEHYNHPVCSAQRDNGERCNIPLERVDVPARFILGESDCCIRHRSHPGRLPGHLPLK